MTSYSYNLFLLETQAIALQNALNHYAAICTVKIIEGEKTPYTSHLQSVTELLERLESSATLASWNNFSDLDSRPPTYIGDCYPIDKSAITKKSD